jgi:hypothetical protein
MTEDLKQRVEETLSEIKDAFRMADKGDCEIDYCLNILEDCGKIIKTLSEQNEKLREGLEILLERFLVWHSTDPEDGVAIRKAKKILEGKYDGRT